MTAHSNEIGPHVQPVGLEELRDLIEKLELGEPSGSKSLPVG
jgi:hypothetical protein